MIDNTKENKIRENKLSVSKQVAGEATLPEDKENLLTPAEQKIQKKSDKWLKFYQKYIETHDLETAYSYTYPNKSTAEARHVRYAGKKLLAKIDSLLGYRQIMDGEDLSDRDLAQKGVKLLDADSEHVQARVLDTMVKSRGWHRDVGADHTGVQIVIMQSGDNDLIPQAVTFDPDSPDCLDYDEDTREVIRPIEVVD